MNACCHADLETVSEQIKKQQLFIVIASAAISMLAEQRFFVHMHTKSKRDDHVLISFLTICVHVDCVTIDMLRIIIYIA